MQQTKTIAESVVPGIDIESTQIKKNEDELPENYMHWQVSWSVRLTVDGRTVMQSTYHQGIGHLRGGKFIDRLSVYMHQELMNVVCGGKSKEFQAEEPEIDDVLYCLCCDADVIEYATFEEWAESLGYNSDSRSDEKIYKACLEETLKLRSALGEEKLSQLREAYLDY